MSKDISFTMRILFVFDFMRFHDLPNHRPMTGIAIKAPEWNNFFEKWKMAQESHDDYDESG